MLKSSAKALIEWCGFEVKRKMPDHAVPLLELKNALSLMNSQGASFDAFVHRCCESAELSKSQIFQDVFVDFVLGKEGGRFVEFGAYDGLTYSNTHFLEHERGWRGILAEPARSLHEKIARDRPLATLDTRCVYSISGASIEFFEARLAELSTIKGYENDDHMRALRNISEAYQVETVSLDDLVAEHLSSLPIDYLSIDTEGTEWEIIKNYSFSNKPTIVTVEHNFQLHRDKIYKKMKEQGYVRVFSCATGFDDWYVLGQAWNARAL